MHVLQRKSYCKQAVKFDANLSIPVRRHAAEKIFERQHDNVIGRKFLRSLTDPRLWISTTCDVFQAAGYTPPWMMALKMLWIGSNRHGQCLKSLYGSWSGPQEDFAFICLMVHAIVNSSMSASAKGVTGGLAAGINPGRWYWWSGSSSWKRSARYCCASAGWTELIF